MTSSTDALKAQLHDLGGLSDRDIPVVKTLLLLAQYDKPVDDVSAYENHIDAMHAALDEELETNPLRAGDNVAEYRLKRLNAVIRNRFNYTEDKDMFGMVETIHLPTVIDRRTGIPVALGALYIELAVKKNWPIFGLNFPGHFLLRLDDGQHRLIFDPYHDGKILDAGGMRHLLKRVVGPQAELSHSYHDTVTPRDVILRFYNNKKTRLISDSRYEEALAVNAMLLLIAPREARLYFDGGVLSVKQGQLKDALDQLERFVGLSTDKRSISEAKNMMADISLRLQ